MHETILPRSQWAQLTRTKEYPGRQQLSTMYVRLPTLSDNYRSPSLLIRNWNKMYIDRGMYACLFWISPQLFANLSASNFSTSTKCHTGDNIEKTSWRVMKCSVVFFANLTRLKFFYLLHAWLIEIVSGVMRFLRKTCCEMLFNKQIWRPWRMIPVPSAAAN